jgi:hypothetical protein
MELFETWKAQVSTCGRERYARLVVRAATISAIAIPAIGAASFLAANVQPELAAQVAVRFFPADSPCGRALAVYLLDRELDRQLVAYRLCDAERDRLARKLRANPPEEEVYEVIVQHDTSCGALSDRILSLLTDRSALAAKAGFATRVIGDVDFAGRKLHEHRAR